MRSLHPISFPLQKSDAHPEGTNGLVDSIGPGTAKGKQAKEAMKQSDSTPPSYGKRLKQERERLGLSQQALAEKVDATFVTISNWERGKTMPGPYHRRRLSELFGKSLQE